MTPKFPNPWVLISLGAVAGFVVGAGVTFVGLVAAM